MNTTITLSRDDRFLRRFLTKERVGYLSSDEVEQLRQAAKDGDAYAQYGYGRWLYYLNPYEGAVREAETLFYNAKEAVPDSLAAYAHMLRYGETEVTHPPLMDIEESQKLLAEAICRGSEFAVMQQARQRMYGQFCEAAPQQVIVEIEQRLEAQPDGDPLWITLLAFAYERQGETDKAIELYEKAISLGEVEDYGYLAIIYKERGNEALFDEYMEEGCGKGSTFCCLYQADTDVAVYDELAAEEQQQLHQAVARRLNRGLNRGDGTCAYFLWLNHYYGCLGFEKDEEKAFAYLKRGVELADSTSISQWLIEDGNDSLPSSMAMTPFERDLLRLRAARFIPNDEDALRELQKADDPAFLLQYKEELEKYWQPRFPLSTPPAEPAKTPIDPMVIIIWPTGHLEVVKADVYEMKSRREMAQEIIGAEGLDAVYYSPLLQEVAKAAELDLNLAMFVDRDAYAKDLDDNAIGTMLYGQGMEIRGPIIITQCDPVHDCHSFKTLEDIVRTYNEINNHCGGLLIIKDEDDGRYDAYA